MANYARGRSPTKTRYRPATSAVNKQLTASKLCTQPARAAFNPAHTVNIDLTSALSFWPARRDCRRRQQDEPKLEEPGTVASHCLQADRSENRLAWLMRAGYFGLLQFFRRRRGDRLTPLASAGLHRLASCAGALPVQRDKAPSKILVFRAGSWCTLERLVRDNCCKGSPPLKLSPERASLRSSRAITLGSLEFHRPCAEGFKKLPQKFACRLVAQPAIGVEFFVSSKDQ